MKFENTKVFNFEGAFRGMRNPLESWNKSDSSARFTHSAGEWWQMFEYDEPGVIYEIGPKDMELAQRLIRGGSEHRKFLRQIFVSVDITAPLYWWKEFDTYKVGTVANSTSTMHKLASKPITIDSFETDDYHGVIYDSDEKIALQKKIDVFKAIEDDLIPFLETLRVMYNKTQNKQIWKELIRWLPESWLQTRTVTMNYENIYSMIKQRQTHKLNEWSGKDNNKNPNFIAWAQTLPYAKELLFIDRWE